MNIALLTPEYVTATQFNGGLANYLHKIAHLLHAEGHRVTVIFQSRRAASWIDEGVEVCEVRCGPIIHWRPECLNKCSGVAHRYLDSRKIARAFWEIHKKDPFDVIQTPSYMTPGLTLVRNGRIPVVCRVSSYTPICNSADGLETRLGTMVSEYLEIRQAALSDSVIAPSEFLVRIFERFAGIKATLIRTPMFHQSIEQDSSFFNEQKPTNPYFIYFGTLNRMKGVDLLGEALPLFFKRYPNYDFVLIGKDAGLPGGIKVMEHLCRTCGPAAGKLHYFPSMPKSKLYPFVANATAVCIPSRVDNYPNTCLEAQVFGVPVIASDDSSIDEIITEGVNGFICENGNALSLYHAMSRCAARSADECELMRRNIIRLSEEIRAENRVAALIGHYEEVIRKFKNQKRAKVNMAHREIGAFG